MASLRYPPLSGGAENQAHLLAQALQRRNHQVSVLSARFDGLPRRTCLDAVEVARLPYRRSALGTAALLALVVAWVVARRSTFDVVHAHIGNPFSGAAVLGARLARRPSIVKVAASGGWSDFVSMRSRTYGAFGRLLLPALMLADRFVVLNGESEIELVPRLGRRRVKRIPNGVAESTRRWQPGGRGRVVFAAGRLDRQKGFDILVEACRARMAQVVIAGDGPDHDALARLADRFGTDLRLLGEVERSEMTAWLLRAGLVAVPSRAEGMSNVLLEALALGCPVVASAVPGNVDLIEHGQTGWLVPRDDAAALRGAIERLFADPERIEALAYAGARRAALEFSIDRVAEQYAALYAELCEA